MGVGRVAIVGAGIAGLTAALALARHGISCDIFEQAAELADVGAGLQLSPNASRILLELGLGERLSAAWTEPEEIALVSGRSLRRLASVPAGEFARRSWGAPYAVLHRADLQSALLIAVEDNPACRLYRGVQTEPDALPLEARNAAVVIGADGVWSRMRKDVTGAPAPRFSGYAAFRIMIAQADAPSFLSRSSVTAFLRSSAHVVCYPLRTGNSFNLVAIIGGPPIAAGWGRTPDTAVRQMLFKKLSGWQRGIVDLFKSRDLTCWPIYETPDGPYQNGRDRVLIGDAAHAMLPFAAQGAAMAIEDAFELAALLARHDASDALPRFEKQRRDRVERVRRRGAFNRFAYHASGPVRLGRDFVLSMKTPESLAADLDWLYGYRAPG